ncbi:unnamed protein product [Leptosia nina]|uniref:Pre-mRNA-splicing factor ISY1 n=1 Tax=Leptosia nina TaxID=320188 RepID=A0AAV1JYI6_9NEOP
MDSINTDEAKSPFISTPRESVKSQNGSIMKSQNQSKIEVPISAVVTKRGSPSQYSPISAKSNPVDKLNSPSSNKSTPQTSNKSEGRQSILQRSPSPQSPKSVSLNISGLQDNANIVADLKTNLQHEYPNETLPYHSDQEGLEIPVISNIDKIANMTRNLTSEANALRESIKSLSDDINKTQQELSTDDKEDVNFPYHLFLIELIINKIHMKCDCFELDYNNLVIAASFLGKQRIVLYDTSYGKVLDFGHLNVGKSILFAMTYDKICNIKEFIIKLQLSKQPPCSSCVTKIAETNMDYTKDFIELREELCAKWTKEQPNDNIICTTTTPLSKQMFHLFCGDTEYSESIGMIEITTRMSFLGKEITTAFSASSKSQGTSYLRKEDHGMSMYACQNVEIDCQGKVLLDEDVLTRREVQRSLHTMSSHREASPMSHLSSVSPASTRGYGVQSAYQYEDGPKKYDEIFTKVNSNELKIRVPKSTKVERMGKYDRTQELCTCEETPYNTGDQIQFQLPKDKTSNTYTSNLLYTHKTYFDKRQDNKEKKIINITPTNCPVPVDMVKQMHPQKDVFILKIGKKLETKDKKTDLEIELVTPKVPIQRSVINNNNSSQQCSSSEVKSKPSKSNVKKNKKKKGKTGLGEFRIRDLNDEINKLMREKRHWEVQIKSLGGPDHARVGPRMLDQDGKEVPGNRGYKYFGAAKDLPGVRELFEQEPPPPPRRTRADLMRDVDADYYGYRDDDDGILIPLEQEAEKDAIASAVEEWKSNKEQNAEDNSPEEENIYPEDPDDKRIEDDSEGEKPVSHVAVPSQKDVEEALLRRKKQELLEKYGCMEVKIEGS